MQNLELKNYWEIKINLNLKPQRTLSAQRLLKIFSVYFVNFAV